MTPLNRPFIHSSRRTWAVPRPGSHATDVIVSMLAIALTATGFRMEFKARRMPAMPERRPAARTRGTR